MRSIFSRSGKSIKTEKGLNNFSQLLTEITAEGDLNIELVDHLGYSKHEPTSSENSRNGFTRNPLKTESRQFEIDTVRDRDVSF